MNLFKKCLVASGVSASLTACSVVSPYIDKAAQMSVESSTKTLEASIYYLCDRARAGDLIRRYPDEEELMRHYKWCLDQNKAKQSIAPKELPNE